MRHGNTLKEITLPLRLTDLFRDGAMTRVSALAALSWQVGHVQHEKVSKRNRNMAQGLEKKLADDSNYLKTVRAHYEQYPYPPRDPEQETTQFKYSYLCA